MRIVIDLQGSQNTSRQRGIGRYSRGLAKAIVRNRGSHEIFILLNGLFPETIDEIKNSFSGLLPNHHIIVFSATGPVDELAPENYWRVRASELIREEFIRDLSPDLLLVSSLFEGADDNTVISIGQLFSQVPTAVILYDLIPYINPEKHIGLEAEKKWYYRKIEHLKRADLLLAISNSARFEAIDHLGIDQQRVVSISSAADQLFSKANLSAAELSALRTRYGINRKFLMHTGVFDMRKNFEGLIKAFGILPKRLRKKYQLVLVYNHDDAVRKSLNDLAAAVGLKEDALVQTGYVPDDDLVALYSECHLFVFPSFHEGFGLPPLEAMCCGAAAIGSNTSSIPEVIGREDALFDPASTESMANLIKRALTDKVFWQALKEHAKTQSKKFSWDKCAQIAIEAFEKLSTRSSNCQAANGDPHDLAYLIENIAYIKGEAQPSEQDLLDTAISIEKNENTVRRLRSFADFSDRRRWPIEGPLDNIYSPALLNRETTRALEELGHPSPFKEKTESYQAIVPAVSESQPINVKPRTNEAIMLSSRQQATNPNTAAIASTFAELLAYHDQEFVFCAYQTLLGRDPDPEGLGHYLGQLRTGISKTRIAVQIRLSPEGKARATTLPGLNTAIRRYRRGKLPLVGWLFRLRYDPDGKTATTREMRSIENRLFVLGDENHRYVNQMDTAIGGLHQLVVQQANNLTEQQNELAYKIEIAIAMLKHHQENQQPLLASSHELISPLVAGKRIIYYYVDHTVSCPVNTGMQRVTRRLGRSLIEIGEDVRFVKWNSDLQRFELINRNELAHLSTYDGPSLGAAEFLTYPAPDDEPVAIDVSTSDYPSWLLVPEVTHITYQKNPVTLDIIMAAKRHELKVAFIYYDAIPLRLKEYQGETAARHEIYMQHLLLADVLIPISHRSGDELRSFFTFHQSAHGNMPVVHPIGLPGETHLSERILTTLYGSSDRKNILCVGSIEPRKNQLKLIQAFEEFSATAQGQEWELILAGNLRADIAASVHQAMQRNSKIRYVQNPSDAQLENLYRDASFTVFTSVEEGFGLPILESLWHAIPCICANFGAMAEVAEGGGCLTVNTNEVSEIRDAIVRLSQDGWFRKELSHQATMRKIICWDEYAQSVSDVLTRVANPLSRSPSIYFWVNDTAVNPHNSGIQRVVRQLARGLISLGVNLIPVKWDSELCRLYPFSPSELAHLAKWNGPYINEWSAWIEPETMQEPKWLLIPELTHGTLGEVKLYAKSLDMRCAAIFYDAIPWKLRDSFPAAFAEDHRQYMEAVGRFDKVFPISHFSRNDLVNFLLSNRARSHSVEHRIQTVSVPIQFPGSERCVTIKTNDESTIRILSVISIEPRKNPLKLIDAFAKAVSRTSRPLTLTLVGRSIPSFAELADNVALKLSEVPGATWVRDVDDTRLRQLYEEADFTVFPSLEEGFGLPIAESIWKARPCITHNSGAMAEIAGDGGCLLINMQDTDALAEAIIDLAENPGRRAALSAEGILRPAKTWEDYAKEIILNMATDRLTDGKPVLQDLRIENNIYRELQNLEPRPSLSVCVTTYNRAGWLEVNLKNLFGQIPHPTKDVEILVVDNTSTDNTPEVVQPYTHRSDFRYIRNVTNVGMLGNLRVTAHEARGKYIWILGDDDLIKPNAIERVLKAIKSHPDVALIYLNYAYTYATDPQDIGDIDQFLRNCPPIMTAGDDVYALTRDIATNNENLFTAIYCLVFRRDHAMKAYSQNTDGRPFSSMRTSIPTTYYILNYMMDEPAYWVGDPILVVNFNVSWNQYATLQILERVPEALDLAERMGANPAGVDRWRENIMSGFVHYFREMFENDPLVNSTFFSPFRLVMRMKHLIAFERLVPALSEIYDRAYLSGHPSAKMLTASLFSCILQPRTGECQPRDWVPSITSTQVGRPSGTAMRTSGRAGALLYGPNASMDSGSYVLCLTGRSNMDGLVGVHVDVAINGGSEVLAQCSLEAMASVNADTWECMLPFTLASACDDLEFRVWVTERSVLSVERIAVTC